MTQTETLGTLDDWKRALDSYRRARTWSTAERACCSDFSSYPERREQAQMMMGIATMRLLCAGLAQSTGLQSQTKDLLNLYERSASASAKARAMRWGQTVARGQSAVLDPFLKSACHEQHKAEREIAQNGAAFLKEAVAVFAKREDADAVDAKNVASVVRELPVEALFNTKTFKTMADQLPPEAWHTEPIRELPLKALRHLLLKVAGFGAK